MGGGYRGQIRKIEKMIVLGVKECVSARFAPRAIQMGFWENLIASLNTKALLQEGIGYLPQAHLHGSEGEPRKCMFFDPRYAIFPDPPTLAFFLLEKAREPRKKARVVLFAETLKSLEKEKCTKTQGKSEKKRKSKKARTDIPNLTSAGRGGLGSQY